MRQWLVVLLVISLVANAVLLASFLAERQRTTQFPHLSPSVRDLEFEEFTQRQRTLAVSYAPLKTRLVDILAHENGEYGVYFEDLTTGAWVGVNERDHFYPRSLLKVPVMVATLKKLQLGELRPEQVVYLLPEDINSDSGTLWQRGPGARVTVDELLRLMVKESDNTAVQTIQHQLLANDDILAASVAMGVSMNDTLRDRVSPKEYSAVLRSLYYSTYLRRVYSEYAIQLLANTSFDDQLPAGIPRDIVVAHKVGYSADEMIYHDCGIIYVPEKPYLLCVMSKGTTRSEANAVISLVSRTVYDTVALQT
jgi:beta-lactamase class A